MNRSEVIAACAAYPGATEDQPFGDDVAVFKVSGKMFALVMLAGEPGFVNLKCDPAWAMHLRAEHSAVQPGYHANKKHWNSLHLDGTIIDSDICDMIRHSYQLVVDGLPKDKRPRSHP